MIKEQIIIAAKNVNAVIEFTSVYALYTLIVTNSVVKLIEYNKIQRLMGFPFGCPPTGA